MAHPTNRSRRLGPCALVVVLVTSASGCVSYTQIPRHEVTIQRLAGLQGQKVRVTSISGERSELVVDRVEYPYLVARDKRQFNLKYTSAVERKEVSETQTAVILGTTAALVAVLAFVYACSTMEFDLGYGPH